MLRNCQRSARMGPAVGLGHCSHSLSHDGSNVGPGWWFGGAQISSVLDDGRRKRIDHMSDTLRGARPFPNSPTDEAYYIGRLSAVRGIQGGIGEAHTMAAARLADHFSHRSSAVLLVNDDTNATLPFQPLHQAHIYRSCSGCAPFSGFCVGVEKSGKQAKSVNLV